MADSRNHSTIAFNDSPVVARRKRGTSIGTSLPNSEFECMPTPPATPKRSKKRVRFLGPRPETELEPASSGLTPSIRRTTLASILPPPSYHVLSTTRRGHSDYGTPISGTIQFESLRQVLDSRVKRRLRRNGLSEEANKIKWEDRREVKLLRVEIERLESELEAKCAEIKSIRDKVESGSSIVELSARVQELEQQVADLAAELHQQEVESEGIEYADSVTASRGLPNPNKDSGRANINADFTDTQVHDDVISIPTTLDGFFPSPPPTMPNTPCKYLSSTNAQAPSSILNPDSPNEIMNMQLQPESELKQIGLSNPTPKATQSSIIRPRKETLDMPGYDIGDKARRQATMWGSILIPISTPNALD